MKIVQGFDSEKVLHIAKNCDSPTVKSTISYITAPFIMGNKGFKVEIIDDVAFFAGTVCKKHFRLYEMAVHQDAQRKGYGALMLLRMKMICQQQGLKKITLRTSKSERAINFYRHVGGVIVGEKDDDYEVEIRA